MQAGFIQNQGDLAKQHIHFALAFLDDGVKAEGTASRRNDRPDNKGATKSNRGSDEELSHGAPQE
jgi:hypothetical protein